MIYQLSRYPLYGNLAIVCFKDDKPNEVYGKLSVNAPIALPDNHFIAKLYSENLNWAPDVINLNKNWFELTGQTVGLGYITAPIVSLTPKFIHDQFELSYNSRTDIFECSQTLFELHEKYCVDEKCRPSQRAYQR